MWRPSHLLTLVPFLLSLSACLGGTLIDPALDQKQRLHADEDLFVFPSMHMGEDDVKVTYRGEPPSDLETAASDVTPAPRRRGVEHTWNPDAINSTVNPHKMRKAATPASVYAASTQAAPRPTPASLLEIVSPSSTTATEAATTASTSTEATTRPPVSHSTASTTVPSTATPTKKTDIRSIWVRSSAQPSTSSAATTTPLPVESSPSPPPQSPTPFPFPFPSSTPVPSSTATAAPSAVPSVSTEFNSISSSSDFQAFEKQKEKFAVLQELLKNADVVKPELAPVTPKLEFNQHDEYDYVYNDDEVIVPRDTAKLLEFPHFPDRGEGSKDFGLKENVNPAQANPQQVPGLLPSAVPSSIPAVQSSTTAASAGLFTVNSSPFPSFPARDTPSSIGALPPHSIFGQGYSVIVPPDGVQDNTVTAAPPPVTVSQLPPRPTPFPTFGVTPSTTSAPVTPQFNTFSVTPSTTTAPITPQFNTFSVTPSTTAAAVTSPFPTFSVTPSTTAAPVTPVTLAPPEEDNAIDEGENSARVPRDFSASQIQLQTPSSISVHHSSLISHPSPQGQGGLGPNSYQSITIIHPNQLDPDHEGDSHALPPPPSLPHHLPQPHHVPPQQAFLPNQIMLHTTASPIYGHNEQTTEAVVLSLPNIRPTDIPEGYELIPLDKLTPSDEIVPWDEAKQVLNVSVSALGAPKVHPLHQITSTAPPFLEDVPRVHPSYVPPPITHFEPPHVGIPKDRLTPSTETPHLVSPEHHTTPPPQYASPTETPHLLSPEYQSTALPPWATRPPIPSSSTLQSLVSSTTITPHGERHAPASLSSPTWLAFPPPKETAVTPIPSLWLPTTSPTTIRTTTTAPTTTTPPPTLRPFTAFSPVPPSLDYSYQHPGYAPEPDHAHLPSAPPPKPEWPQAPPISPDLPTLFYDESPKAKDPVEEEKTAPPLVVKSLPKSYGQVIHFGSDFSPHSPPAEAYDVSKPGPYFKSINVFYDNVNAGPTTAHPDVKEISLTPQPTTPSLHHFTPIHVPSPSYENAYSTPPPPPPPKEEKKPHVADILYYDPYSHGHKPTKPTPTPLLPHPEVTTTQKPRPIELEPEVGLPHPGGGQFDLPPPRPEFVASYLQKHHTTPKPDYFATSSTFSPRKVPALPDLLMKPPPAHFPPAPPSLHLPHQLHVPESPDLKQSLYAYPSYGGGSNSPPPVVKSLSRTPHPKRSYDPSEAKHLLSGDPFSGQHSPIPDFYTSPQPVFHPATTTAPFVERPAVDEEDLPEASDLRMQQLRKYLDSLNYGDPSTLLDQTVLRRLLNMLDVSAPVSTSTSRSDAVSSTTEFYTTASTTTTPATTASTTTFTTASPTFTTTTTTASPTFSTAAPTFSTTSASPMTSLHIPKQTYISQNSGLAPNGHVLSLYDLHDNESSIWGMSNQDDRRVSELARMLSSMQKKMQDFEQAQQLKQQVTTENPTEMLTQMTHMLDNLMTVVHGLNTTVVEAASKMYNGQPPESSRTLDFLQDKLVGLTAKVNSMQERQEMGISKDKVREVLLEVVNEMRNVARLRSELEEVKPIKKKAKPKDDLPPVKKSISPSNIYVLPMSASPSPSMASPLNRTAINVYANSLLLVPGSYAMSTTARPFGQPQLSGMWHPTISPALMSHAQPRGLVSSYPVHLADTSALGQSGLGFGQSASAVGQTGLGQTAFGQSGIGQTALGMPSARVNLNVMSDVEQRDSNAKQNLFARAASAPDPYILQTAPKRSSSQLEMIMYPSGQLLKGSDLEPSASTVAPRLALPESPPVGLHLPHYVLTTKRRSDVGPEDNSKDGRSMSLLPQLMRTARDDIKLVGNVIKLALS